MDATYHIACTRVIDAQLKQEALQKGFVVDDKDVLHIDFLDTPSLVDTLTNNTFPLVFTSQYGVLAVVELINKHHIALQQKSAFCISGKTAKLATEAGFSIVETAPNAELLAAKIAALKPTASLLHLSANMALTHWKTFLAAHQLVVNTVEVYHKTIQTQTFAKADAVMFFSPSQIDGYLKSNSLLPSTPAFCIGETTAKHLLQTQHKNTHVANEPSEQALLNHVYHYFNS